MEASWIGRFRSASVARVCCAVLLVYSHVWLQHLFAHTPQGHAVRFMVPDVTQG